MDADRRSVRYAVVAGLLCFGVAAALLTEAFQGADDLEDVIWGAYREGHEYHGLEIVYPLNEARFPPEIVAPTFRWSDEQTGADTWLITVRSDQGESQVRGLTDATQWTPSPSQWEAIKQFSVEQSVTVTVLGAGGTAPDQILSAACITISTSKDEVGAPLFYREVNLPFIEAVKDPTRIRWRLGSVSSPEPPPVVLDNLPVCGNCHSFSKDACTLGMDVDYANDKGSYAIAPVEKEISLTRDRIITWNDYKREDREPTFGLLSQVSPDGRYVISTVKDASVFVAQPGLEFSQLFFPVKGILVFYDREARTFHPLPGADDKEFVQSNPTWSPQGKYVVFARSRVHKLKSGGRGTRALLTKEECREFLEGGETFQFDLYRIPFNGGQGGQPEPLEGASHNGMSNYFPKYSPNGKWIVFCKAKSFMLLQPDSELHIVSAQGGKARRLRCNTQRMNSWHSWSPNGRWLAFSSKANGPYTQLWLAHIDEQGRSSPPVVLAHFTEANRAANIPEFVHLEPGAVESIRQQFVDAYSFVRAAREYLVAGDLDGAIHLCQKALKLDPDSAEAHDHLGDLLVRNGMTQQAKAHFARAIECQPEYVAAHLNLGLLLCNEGDPKAAIRHLRRAQQIDPARAEAYNDCGVALCDLGRFDEAIEQYQSALDIDPQYTACHYNLGCLLTRLGRLSQAVEHFERALAIDSQLDSSHYGLANALMALARVDGAIEHYRKALEINPENAGAHNNLGLALVRQAGFRQAIEHYSRAVELNPRSDVYHYNWANALVSIRQFDQAAAHYREAVQLNPEHDPARNNLGVLLIQQGKAEQAIAHWKQTLAIHPDNIDAHVFLGNALAAQGEFAPAIAHLQKAIQLAPDDLRALNQLAWLWATCPRDDLRNGPQAIALAERVCKATGHQAPAPLDTLAAAYAEAGRFSDATATATRALALARTKQKSLADRIRRHLEQYKAGRPHRLQH